MSIADLDLAGLAAKDPGAARLLFYRCNPAAWVEAKFGITLAKTRSEDEVRTFLDDSPNAHTWAKAQLANDRLRFDFSYQAAALDLLGEPIRDGLSHFTHRVAMKWANGIGKTAVIALAVLWFIDVFPGGRVLSTAGTWSQLREQLWREIASWNSRAAANDIVSRIAKVDKTQIDVAPDWAAIGRAASGEATFEGVHAPYVMLIFDEAKAIRPDVWRAARRILRGDGQYWFVAASSPGSPSGEFFEVTRGSQAKNWNVLSMSAYEAERVSLDQVEADAEDLGEESPLFVAMDCGEFPDEGEKTLIPLSWVLNAVDRKVATKGWRTLGLDVAGRGNQGDETVLGELRGRKFSILERYRGFNSIWTTAKVNEHAAKKPVADMVAIDDTAIGEGTTDQVEAMEWPVVRIRFGESAINPERFVNLKSELYWRIRSELEAGFNQPDNPNVGFSLPDDKKLHAELTGIEYDYDERLRIKVEGHKAMEKRNFPSPNSGDSLVLANAARSDVGRVEIDADIPDVLPV